MLGFQFLTKIITPILTKQIVAHTYHQRGIEHMTRGPLVRRRNLDRRMRLARGGPADQQRCLEAAPLHFLGIKNHFIQRRRDQPAQANDVRVVFLGGL